MKMLSQSLAIGLTLIHISSALAIEPIPNLTCHQYMPGLIQMVGSTVDKLYSYTIVAEFAAKKWKYIVVETSPENSHSISLKRWTLGLNADSCSKRILGTEPINPQWGKEGATWPIEDVFVLTLDKEYAAEKHKVTIESTDGHWGTCEVIAPKCSAEQVSYKTQDF